jgi:hypothetical protein
MKTVNFDSGFLWDDPNLRWGEPTVQLEPGDPGYVPVQPPSQNKKTAKNKHMRRNAYFPARQADQIVWLENYRNKVSGYATTLNLAPATATATVADARWLIYVLNSWSGATRAWAQACTDAVLEAESGDGTAAMALPVFTAPALPTGVTATNTGALDRIFGVVQTIKESPAYTETIGTDLGLVGSELTPPDFTTLKPVFKTSVTAAGVQIAWTWGGYSAFLDMIELQVDRGDGKGFVFLATDTTPGYVDTFAHPATPAKWTYRAIYRAGDAQVGQWSAPVSVAVAA